MHSHNFITYSMELRSKAVPKLVSSKSTQKKVSEVVERKVFEDEVKSKCGVGKKEKLVEAKSLINFKDNKPL